MANPVVNQQFMLPTASQEGSLLMDLPTEIRVEILKRLVVNSKYLTRGSIPQPPVVAQPEQRARHLAIFRVCQQLHQEAIMLFYRNNRLSISLDFWTSGPHIFDWHSNCHVVLSRLAQNSPVVEFITRFSKLRLRFRMIRITLTRYFLPEPCLEFLTSLDLSQKRLRFSFDRHVRRCLTAQEWTTSWMSLLGRIRCRTAHFSNVKQKGMDKMIATMESNPPVPDIWTESKHLLARLRVSQRPREEDDVRLLADIDLEHTLRKAVEEFDFDTFEETRAAIIVRCNELLDKLVDAQENRAQ